ncbi:MAG: SDR family NAD(P)-dependent oxidoreductase [Acidobacteria bacterium]|nr:MAG: SDR family NAD(P)-dependent oxidoreductase [Acidobacteriota bacterium]REK02241.1 MAG: SDR family NAD(P)-dependent oxidoreductase [Acidobacteriota bacterium]REK13956.1 MAG: SDR family NAD(P)-dependent oxidoreductase [Acidobacteriota bacterium]REK41951.1 MAG: SDR family NAD(P)-dependent oxidoreductase [Acidobacteriota bacterium]
MPTPGQHAFSEKVALVTNATSPIGRAVSMQLGLYGAFVIACHGETSDSESDAVDELKSLGTLAHSISADVSTPEGVDAVVEKIGDIYGRLDLLVNCPFASDEPGFESSDIVHFRDTFSSVVKPSFLLVKQAQTLFEDRPKVRIVNVLVSKEPRSDGAGMLNAAANSAVESLTSSMASFLTSKFRVNAVSVSENGSKAEVRQDLDPELFRPTSGVDADDVARAVIYLLSSEAKGVNGQVLRIG